MSIGVYPCKSDHAHHLYAHVERYNRQAASFPSLAKPAAWFQERFERIEAMVPNFLRPRYFALVISTAYKAARRAVVEQCSDFVVSGHDLIQNLALCSIQMHGVVKSASLDPSRQTPSLAAGLPHFTTGWARCWGRDVFISLRGLFLTTGNYDAAKRHILAFASTLKHGLIPNLLDSVRNPRYGGYSFNEPTCIYMFKVQFTRFPMVDVAKHSRLRLDGT